MNSLQSLTKWGKAKGIAFGLVVILGFGYPASICSESIHCQGDPGEEINCFPPLRCCNNGFCQKDCAIDPGPAPTAPPEIGCDAIGGSGIWGDSCHVVNPNCRDKSVTGRWNCFYCEMTLPSCSESAACNQNEVCETNRGENCANCDDCQCQGCLKCTNKGTCEPLTTLTCYQSAGGPCTVPSCMDATCNSDGSCSCKAKTNGDPCPFGRCCNGSCFLRFECPYCCQNGCQNNECKATLTPASSNEFSLNENSVGLYYVGEIPLPLSYMPINNSPPSPNSNVPLDNIHAVRKTGK